MPDLKLTSFLLSVIFGLLLASSVHAQSFSVKPNLARMDNDKIGYGVDVEAAYEKEYTVPSETG
ncbi:MAG: hypothetical protein GVY20_03780, partial [Bacteroidetes bacterium]|nr:hypothetical protein [Bacteroidota bacterium]